ncbi:MAG: DUF2604 domain-containing protein [Gemmatimonadaceae bacterium]
MAHKENFDVTVVVSGQATNIRTNVHQSVEHLVKEALKESGNKGQPPSEWELRTSDGALIDQSLEVGAAGITEGITLFLSPRAGAGGNG